MLTTEDLRAMTPDQLDDELLKLKKEQFNLRFQRATGQLANTSRVREVRRDIARIKTAAQAKPVVVRVERRFTHPVMKKTVRSSKKYYAHDEKGEYGVGDLVWIEEHRPISKLKRWTVVQGQKKASVSA